MKFLCDVHITYQLVNYLQSKGHQAIHVNHILQKWNTSDTDIAHYADKNGFVLITKDIDFRNSFVVQGTPAKLIRIVLGNISNKLLIELFEKNLQSILKNLQHSDCYIEINHGDISIITSFQKRE